jgi:GIY-YIG catalytic domain
LTYPTQPGVYCFWNKVSNKIYVGSALCLNKRIKKHLSKSCTNQHLQNAIKYYGIDSFCITYYILESFKAALYFEQMLLNFIFTKNIECYNISKIATGVLLKNYNIHQSFCEAGGGSKAKIRYALEVNNPDIIHTFKSSVEAANFTKVPSGKVSYSCSIAKPYNSESGRWLFSDVSEADLAYKFNNLTRKEIKGLKRRKS